MGNLLIIDRDEYYCADVCQFCLSVGHSIYSAVDYAEALAQVGKHDFDLVICNVALSGGSIHSLINEIRRKDPQTLLIAFGEPRNVQLCVQLVKDGLAADFLQKPFTFPELNFHIRRILAAHAASHRAGAPAAEETAREAIKPYSFIGKSPAMEKVLKMVSRVAPTNASVIILGETGTGKDLVAQAIHFNSLRADGPFVPVNCAALPEQLLESELFGFEKGAFTGADRTRVGRFEHADGGTIFLDEVADMSLATQAKVLRIIQKKEFERIGSNQTIRTDVRILSATNKDLAAMMREGKFREDLYYRLNVVTIRLPPLRERDGDVRLLIDFFVARASRDMGKKIKGVDAAAMAILCDYEWPGNIRELENTVERAVLMAEGPTISAEDLGLLMVADDAPSLSGSRVRLPAGGISLAEAEKQLIEQAMERCGGVQKRAAELLGISGRVLNYKLKMLRERGTTAGPDEEERP